MATRTVWDRDLAGPDTETNWDGVTNTQWDVLAEFLGRGPVIVWMAAKRIISWA